MLIYYVDVFSALLPGSVWCRDIGLNSISNNFTFSCVNSAHFPGSVWCRDVGLDSISNNFTFSTGTVCVN